MTNSWEKRYTFRLTEDDDTIQTFLENVPKNKRSEVIRKMLHFAYNTMTREQKEQEQIDALKAEIKLLNETVLKNHKEIMNRLENGTIMDSLKKEYEISEEAIEDSAYAMLTSFGVDMD
ncbi:hypothetical protein EYB33_12280 [Lysinibacillus sphaericus]|uniref:hypothetical protein n=1 Tax=Lysinibacillus TaxID=400634 RepID=UPI00084B3B93|nr:hypothetical protein [Lysinibacillus sphaericus]OEC01258.1 hypothetical protein GY31_13195 [Lysinibacillus sphaericus]UDK97034.1 hypothetical protein EYB33_12280 [Lysinibacillus sphaericus]